MWTPGVTTRPIGAIFRQDAGVVEALSVPTFAAIRLGASRTGYSLFSYDTRQAFTLWQLPRPTTRVVTKPDIYTKTETAQSADMQDWLASQRQRAALPE
jgi:hypothetical protein